MKGGAETHRKGKGDALCLRWRLLGAWNVCGSRLLSGLLDSPAANKMRPRRKSLFDAKLTASDEEEDSWAADEEVATPRSAVTSFFGLQLAEEPSVGVKPLPIDALWRFSEGEAGNGGGGSMPATPKPARDLGAVKLTHQPPVWTLPSPSSSDYSNSDSDGETDDKFDSGMSDAVAHVEFERVRRVLGGFPSDLFSWARNLRHVDLWRLLEDAQNPHADLERAQRFRRYSRLRNHEQQTALHVALKAAETHARKLNAGQSAALCSTVGALLSLGLDPNAAEPRRNMQRPLHAAVRLGEVSLVDKLLSAGAQASLCDSNGLTPLHVLCSLSSKFTGDLGAVQMASKLLGTGADPNALNRQGQSCYLLLSHRMGVRAAENKSPSTLPADLQVCVSVLRLLLQHEAVSRTVNAKATVFTPVEMKDATPLGLLVRAIAAPEVRRDYVNTLSVAATLLLSHGAHVLDPAVGASDKTILDVIVEERLDSVIGHPAVQRELESLWQPQVSLDVHPRLQRFLPDRRKGNLTAERTGVREFARLHWKSRRRLFCGAMCFYFLWVLAVTVVAAITWQSRGDVRTAQEAVAHSWVGADSGDILERISSREDVWTFLQGPTASFAILESETHWEPVFPPIVRQFRGQELSGVACQTIFNANASDSDSSCVGRFVFSRSESPDPFVGIPYSTPDDLGVHSTFEGATGVTYGVTGGFAFFLRNSSSLAALKEQEWLDRKTAAIVVDSVSYNADIAKFVFARVLFEFPLAGSIVGSASFHALQLPVYLMPGDLVRVCLEIGVLVTALLMAFRQVRHSSFSWIWSRWSNVNSAMLFVAVVIAACIRVVALALSDKGLRLLREEDLSLEGAFDVVGNMHSHALISTIDRGAMGIVVLIAWIGIFRFLRIFSFVGVPLRLFAHSMGVLLRAFVPFVALLFAFAISLHLLGQQRDYSTVFGSVELLLSPVALEHIVAEGWLVTLIYGLYVLSLLSLLLALFAEGARHSEHSWKTKALREFQLDRAEVIRKYAPMRGGHRVRLVDVELSGLHQSQEGTEVRRGHADLYSAHEVVHELARRLRFEVVSAEIAQERHRTMSVQSRASGIDSPVNPIVTLLLPGKDSSACGALKHMRRFGHVGYTITPSSISRGDDLGFIRPETRTVRQPQTANIPFSNVVVDLGKDFRLFVTACRIGCLPKERVAPKAWILQGTNDAQAAIRSKLARPDVSRSSLTRSVRDADEHDAARVVADLSWTTLFVHTAEHRHKKDRVDRYHETLECWAGLPAIAKAKEASSSPVPGAFRFFRVLHLGDCEEERHVSSIGCINRSHVLSFCGLELYGGLVELPPTRPTVTKTVSTGTLLGGSEAIGSDLHRPSATLGDIEAMAEDARNLGEPFSTLFNALAAIQVFDGSDTREEVRRAVSELASRQDRLSKLVAELQRANAERLNGE
jgi:ankyrin repeat protein